MTPARSRILGVFAAAGLAAAASASADEAPETGSYNLFRPTPREFMRELVTDRPDKTESPHTVDAGHYQIELDILSFTYAQDRKTTAEEFAIAPINFKVGLLNDLDFQLIAETFNVQRTRDRAARTDEEISGFGDVTLRVKKNFWGNDGGATAFGVIPFLKLPTSQNGLGNGAVEGGIILPLSVKLPHEFELGAMTEVDCIRNEERSGYHPEFINSVTVSHALVGKLSGYAEFFSSISAQRGSDWVGTLDFGLTYMVTRDVQLDTGVNIGMTRGADDVNPFVGLSVRY